MCLEGFRLASEMFQKAIGPGVALLGEPIKQLRRGIEIQMFAPKVPLDCATSASTTIASTDLIDVGSYSCGYNGDGDIRYELISLLMVPQKCLNTH